MVSEAQLKGTIEFTPPPVGERSREAFWQKYGPISDLTEDQFGRMCDTSANQIGNDYGYHNAEHPFESLWVAMHWVDFFEAQGMSVNRKVVIGSVMYHDDSFHEDHEAKGYNSKEEYSAARFKEDAPSYDYTAEETMLGAEAIVATRRKEIPKSIEGVITVLADVWNMGGDYDKDFHPKTLSYADEIEKKAKRAGKDFSMQEFLDNSITILADYAWVLISQNICNVDDFIRKAVPNLKHLAREAAKLQGITVGQYYKKLEDPVKSLLRIKVPGKVLTED